MKWAVTAALLVGLVLAGRADAATPELRRCGGALCGSIERPLGNGRTIDVAFRWYRGDGSRPPIVAVEGGPGYPSTGSRWEYRGIFGPLVRSRGLLLVDNRGTGDSALIDCRSVQGFPGRTSGRPFARRVGRCAAQFDARYGRGAHSYFATAYAADDLAAVMRALRLGKVDLYGDSYGTFFVQEFIARHPSTLHSVVLDSAYPRRDLDPWYASSGAAARAAMETVSPGSVARLGELLARVRTAPIVKRTRDADTTSVLFRVDTRVLADMVQDAASDPVILRELDASVRAALAGDDVPLVRLAAQSSTWNHSPSDASYFSRGAYLAVSCLDYPRLASFAGAPEAFAPFTAAEWLTISGFSQPYDICLDWPASKRPPAVPDVKVDVPILIVGGDLDSLTPLSDAPTFAPGLGDDVTIVTLRNTVHVTSEGDNYLVEGMRCARNVMRSFIRGALDSTCAASIPALHTPDYPLTLSAAAPATLVSGPDPGESARRAATVAAQAFADATMRWVYTGGGRLGAGLRGGRFSVRDETFSFQDVRFVSDATVSGAGTFKAATGAVDATLTVAGVTVHLRWTQATPQARAEIGGSVLSLPAP
ncbi:alpha/beta hydrolase [Solirubrobacter soli]|uniref:alpha/beta hydrolase n=1 Tax=Solirubrobacter soli TaxID=363832 RepID=UPI000421BC19|nr:alpha/beta hydrolase [Solirubrobacter soli]